jgi:hypothetical protein
MDQDIKHLLEENLKLSKENNELLIKVRNVQKWSQITRALYWFVIIGIAFGAFYFIKPYLGNMLNLYTGGVSKVNNLSEITKTLKDQQQIDALLELLKK